MSAGVQKAAVEAPSQRRALPFASVKDARLAAEACASHVRQERDAQECRRRELAERKRQRRWWGASVVLVALALVAILMFR